MTLMSSATKPTEEELVETNRAVEPSAGVNGLCRQVVLKAKREAREEGREGEDRLLDTPERHRQRGSDRERSGQADPEKSGGASACAAAADDAAEEASPGERPGKAAKGGGHSPRASPRKPPGRFRFLFFLPPALSVRSGGARHSSTADLAYRADVGSAFWHDLDTLPARLRKESRNLNDL
ncbi:hypothetical protein HPB47_008312 [Ixodes persulcatus]|uniref:Uncharacterized protein n=1 Tax=Ixodes persulcatus TaxID=34615 RepID=A0AC60P564_IXOPE|nr:hypothetical protein HPB47_008312 [Ixodes persulcatus]